MSDEIKDPQLVQFRNALANGTAFGPKASAYKTWLDRLAQRDAGSALHQAAQLLWGEYEVAATRRNTQGTSARPPEIYRRDDRSGHRGGAGTSSSAGRSPQRGDNAGAAEPAQVLEGAFHNPYTFIPFPKSPPRRRKPTPLTSDERDPSRRSGYLVLTLETKSPLLSCHPTPTSTLEGHKQFEVLRIGNDVIVPATGVRGALRSLLSILVGGTLSYVDENVWLTQGRDLNLGPAGATSAPEVPDQCYLARVVEPGDARRPGTVQLGKTELVKADDLESTARRCGVAGLRRPTDRRVEQSLWCDGPSVREVSVVKSPRTPWQVKLSGRPVNVKGKREGIFLGDGPEIELPPALWGAFEGRHRHGVVNELRRDDLVWLHLRSGADRFRTASDVESIQWARWGRRGVRLLDLVREQHSGFQPDSFNSDGLVDAVTDLFGQVPMKDISRDGQGPAGPFAARVRPENLVFRDAYPNSVTKQVALAPLQPPHPGCAAFYRAEYDPDAIANDPKTPLRGYKVYRTAVEGDEPWRFEIQSVYGDDGRPGPPKQRVNKTCDLLNRGCEGTLRLSFRALSKEEVAMLVASTMVDWRLGGGKPFGLGHCRISQVQVFDERGKLQHHLERESDDAGALPKELEDVLPAEFRKRMKLWQASQMPVKALRYPRAVNDNENRKQRGGHAWFQRHASVRKGTRGEDTPRGLEVMWVEGELAAKAKSSRIRGQFLPPFNDKNAEANQLFGFDLIVPRDAKRQERDRRTFISRVEPFDPKRHVRGDEKSGGNQSQNKDTRRDDRGAR